MDKIVDFINVNRDRYIDEMKRYLAIPSISALPAHAADVRTCAEWTADEMRRSSAGLEFDFVSALQSNLGKAEMLSSGLVFHGDPAYYKTEYARLEAVTAADVKRVANRYLTPGRVVLSIVPQDQRDLAAQPDRSTTVTVSPDGGHYIMEHD